jgi:hypothetical protein
MTQRARKNEIGDVDSVRGLTAMIATKDFFGAL